MNRPHFSRLPSGESRLFCVVAAVVLWTFTLPASPQSGWAAGWTGSAGMKSGCVGWNCDGKNPCTGMGCEGSGSAGSSEKNQSSKTSSTSTGSGAGKSGATKNSKGSTESAKGSNKTKDAQTLPDMEGLTGKSQSDGWGGSRDSDTRTDEQRAAQDAAKSLPDLQGLTGGGKPPPDGWDGGLKSDSRTIEQKLH